MRDDHAGRYGAAIAELRRHKRTPDAYWRSALWLLTFRDDIWQKALPWVNLKKAEITPLAEWRGTDFSSGQYVVVQVALHLFNDCNQSPPISDLFRLDNGNYRAVREAMDIFRGVPIDRERTAAAAAREA